MPLADEIRDFVNLTHANAWRMNKSGEPYEPALVSSFLNKTTCEGLRQILQKHAVSGTGVLVHGIFTHQSPIVKPFGSAKGVEIADLMLIHQHIDTKTGLPTKGRAVLLQAKRARTAFTGTLKGSDAIQFDLYQNWPQFTALTPLSASPKGFAYWDFNNLSANNQAATDGASYFTVFRGHAFKVNYHPHQWTASVTKHIEHKYLNKNYTNCCAWGVGACPPSPSTAKTGIICKTDFGDFFANFLSGKSGRAFVPAGQSQQAADHWSSFVNRMLELSAPLCKDYVYNLAKQSAVNVRRGNIINFLSAAPTLYHAAISELGDILHYGLTPSSKQTPTSLFYLTGRAIVDNVLQSDSVGSDGPPNEDSEFIEGYPPGGHVPFLHVITYGMDEFPFRQEST